MRPEWLTAAVATIGALMALVNVYISLRTQVSIGQSERRILQRVSEEYKRKDVCEADMNTLRAECGR